MSTATRHVTADQLLHMPDDGYRYELVEGELHRKTPSGFEHGFIVGELSGRLWQHVRDHSLGCICGAETGFRLSRDPDTILAPDIAFIRQERIDVLGVPTAYFPEAPALAVEVVSPGDTIDEVNTKLRRWLASGVELVWIVNPRGRTVTAYRSPTDAQLLTENDLVSGETLIPGFACRVGDFLVNR